MNHKHKYSRAQINAFYNTRNRATQRNLEFGFSTIQDLISELGEKLTDDAYIDRYDFTKGFVSGNVYYRTPPPYKARHVRLATNPELRKPRK